ncbi:MAG: response regulator [Xanthomonadaceae bacterium]|nr:response regulator [Xanthomonadaceae bacterium]
MPTRTNLNILIVDDSEDDALLLVRALQRSGYEIHWQRVENRKDMLASLEAGPWDVVISDYNMPEFSALDALNVIQKTGRDVPFIVVSGAVGEERAVEIMLAGAHDFVVKQNLARLAPVIRRELGEAGFREQRRRDEEQLQLQAAALDSAANGILITDRDGLIEWVNQAFTELTGYTRQEVEGRHISILESGRHGERFYEGLWHTILDCRNWRGELVNRRRDGSEYIEEQSITSVRRADGEISHFIVIQQDVTERVRAAREREDLQRQLQQAHKMEALGQLTGGIAHDFNNILGAIIGYTDLALERFAPGGEGKLGEYLNQVYRAALRARDLIAQMLAYSRGGGSSTQVLPMEPVVREVIKMLRSAMPATMEFHTEFAPDTSMVSIDPVQLHQVIMNLCINARDAMEGHGRMDVCIAPVRDLRAICASCHRPVEGDFVQLEIRDTGTGIAADVLPRLFEPFFTTKPVGSGTGMGLPVVHGILHEHGGHLLVDTTIGEGSCFRLLLPALAAMEVREEPREYVATTQVQGHGHVLVVDDEPRLVAYYAELLEAQGYRVTGVTDGREALRYFRASPGDIDLVITDQTMPEMTGASLVRQLLELRPDLPVILCSGYSDEIDARGAQELRVAAYFQKPVIAGELLARVGELLNQSGEVDE